MTSETETEFTRLPGLYRSWDLGILIEEGWIYRIEEGGRTEDGQALFAVFMLDPTRNQTEAGS